jgi:hypothetical protein
MRVVSKQQEISMTLTRKEFLRSIVGTAAGVAGAAVLIGCSDDKGSADAAVAGNCTANDPATSIGSNHPPPGVHTFAMAVSKADVTAGVDKTYDITGASAHMHAITITAAEFTQLKNSPGMPLMISSTAGGTDGHKHTVTVSCV